MPGQPIQSGKPYLHIVGGNICQTVPKGTPNARYREHEPRSGESESVDGKWELVFQNWTGKIMNIEIKKGNYGRVCNIELEDSILSMGTSSNFFQDFASKVFSGDLKQTFLFHPYEMQTDKGKKRGMSLQQNGEKLKNYFWDGEKTLHGAPDADQDKKNEEGYWKIYFIQLENFLVEKLKQLKFETLEKPSAPDNELEHIDDLPF